MCKIIVAGSRTIKDLSLVDCVFSKGLAYFCLNPKDKIMIISGGAQGVDTMAILLAQKAGHDYIIVPANWDYYGKSAGHRRNKLMADLGDFLIAVWDGKSRGTYNMIETMMKAQKLVYIYNTCVVAA